MSSVAQVLRQADTLKATISDSGKNISELWVTRQRLEDLYKKILLMDLEYALDKKVEQDLWNHAFKNQINILQTQAKDKQNAKRGEVQASLNLFLETASGFYLQFLQQICTTFKLDLPFRRKSAVFGVMKEKCQLKTRITPPKKSSCLYVCQHCLVHLGDIARYRQQVEQAQTYYQHAANLVPQNGQPYNQLAILEAARGNKLSTVFYYIRSLAVRHPFPVAATNLEKFYAKLTKDIFRVEMALQGMHGGVGIIERTLDMRQNAMTGRGQAGLRVCVLISNDVIVALLYHIPVLLQHDLDELWVRTGVGDSTRKGSSLDNLPSTSHSILPRIQRAFYNAHTTMHALQSHFDPDTVGSLKPQDCGYEHDQGQLMSATSQKTLEVNWSVICSCDKCIRILYFFNTHLVHNKSVHVYAWTKTVSIKQYLLCLTHNPFLNIIYFDMRYKFNHVNETFFPDLNKASSLKDKLLSSLPSHVITQSFTSSVLIQFVAITIFSLHHIQKELNVGSSSNQGAVTKDEQRCFQLMFSFMICVLDILLQNTPKQEPKAREFFTLPAVKIIFDWLHLNKDCIDKQVLVNSGFWSSLAKLLNNLQTLSNKENTPDSVRYEDVPLPEDCEVRCFQPIEKAHGNYSFSRVSVDSLPLSVEVHLRYLRLIEHGKWLAMEFSSSNVFCCVTLKSGHLQFSAPGSQNRDGSGSITEKKFGRQNVAMQAIIQKQEQQEATDSDMGTSAKIIDGPGLYEIDRNIPLPAMTGQTSPKYFLGIPTNEPQFMKLKHAKTTAIASAHMRFNGSNVQQSPAFPGYISPSQTNGSGPQQHMGYPGRNSTQAQLPPRMMPGGQGQCMTPGGQGQCMTPGGQGQCMTPGGQGQCMTPGGQGQPMTPGNQGPRLSPGNQSNPPRTSPNGTMGSGVSPQSMPQCAPFMMQPPVFSQNDPYQMASPMVAGSMIGSPGVTPPDSQTGPMISPTQQQIRAAMMRQPPPTVPLGNLSPSQVIAAMALTNQMNAQQQQLMKANQQGAVPPQLQPHHLFQQALGTERVQTSPKDQQQPGQTAPLKPGYPSIGGAAGFPGLSAQGSPMGAPPFRHAPPPLNSDGQPHQNVLIGFNPLTIKPPRPPFQEQRLNSTFQGHAEGTPKPGGFYPERREPENVSSKSESQPTSQPGVYSLFSNSPWAVPISATGDSKSLGSSPFSSAASSIRNSPEHSTEPPTAGPPAFDLGLRFSSSDAHWGAQVPSETHHNDDDNQYLNSIQSIWNASAPSPLERLLEQQKQKRQNEPH
ncbi:protein SMG7-like [Gigantopelta aegis]|uniref:protein SMG7-like n=1 Tax=Gigantopelta aegis TaxID=1735272 RepID=UPI001B88D58D|nr:protein SMG7-like [Gigantopelta aegis]